MRDARLHALLVVGLPGKEKLTRMVVGRSVDDAVVDRTEQDAVLVAVRAGAVTVTAWGPSGCGG
jgi:hypothetical protein